MRKQDVAGIAVIFFFAVIMCAAQAEFAWAEADAGKREDIKKLLHVSGIYDQINYMKENVLGSYSQAISFSFPNIPDAFWDEFNNLIGQKEMDDLISRVIPVYDQHMDHAVIRELIKMFETPFWEEWRKKMPAISREAGLAGSRWAQEISQSDIFNKKIDSLVKKYELGKLNPKKEKTE